MFQYPPHVESSYPLDTSSPPAVLCRWVKWRFYVKNGPLFGISGKIPETVIFAFFGGFPRSADDCDGDFDLKFHFPTEELTKDKRPTTFDDRNDFL